MRLTHAETNAWRNRMFGERLLDLWIPPVEKDDEQCHNSALNWISGNPLKGSGRRLMLRQQVSPCLTNGDSITRAARPPSQLTHRGRARNVAGCGCDAAPYLGRHLGRPPIEMALVAVFCQVEVVRLSVLF